MTDAYLEHLAFPRNHGELAPADRAGEVGSVVGGLGVRVMLRLARAGGRVPGIPPDAPIERATFRAVGSAAPRAPGSVLTGLLEGRDAEAARRIAPEALLDGFGNVPPAVARSAAMLVEALHAALAQGGDGERASTSAARADAPGLPLCRCLGVGDRRVRRAIREGARTVEAIGAYCHAGEGCHSCWPDLREILEEETRADAGRTREEAGARGGTPLSRAVAAVVGPFWRAQGVRLGTVAVEESGVEDGARTHGAVRLGVAGVEPGALATPIGAFAMARHRLREVLGEDVRVEPEST